MFILIAGVEMTRASSLRLSLTQVARAMDYESSLIRYQLQGLVYSDYGTSQLAHGPRSSVTVEWTDLSFHVKTRGNLSDEEKDTICHELLQKVKKREEREVEKLHLLYATLRSVAKGKEEEEEEEEVRHKLKSLIQDYFEDRLTGEKLRGMGIDLVAPTDKPLAERQTNQLCHDIATLVSNHRDQGLTGRAVARILHGIASPCFPAEVWGRRALCWRSHLEADFNLICQMATKQLLGLH